MHEWDPGEPNVTAPSWTIGSPNDPQPVAFDPGLGSWIKDLTAAQGGTVFADDDPNNDPGVITGIPQPPLPTVFAFTEHLVVGPGPAWVDWHEEILTPGWDWDVVTIGSNGTGTVVTPKLLANGVPQDNFTHMPPGAGHGGALWWVFESPLPPGTVIDITKDLVFVGTNAIIGDEVFNQPVVQVAQYPTVPTPSALWFLALLSAAGVCRRRRDR